MSKQSEAKEKQKYSRDIKNCGNCKHFTSDKEKWNYGTIERNLRCSVGKFKVHKTAKCDLYETISENANGQTSK